VTRVHVPLQALAKTAGEQAAAAAAAQAEMDTKPAGFDEALAEIEKLGAMQDKLSELEGALAAAMGWQVEVEQLKQKVEPVPMLQQGVYDVKQELPRKVDEADLGKLQMELQTRLDQLTKQVLDLSKNQGSSLGADVEAALRQLASMDLKGVLGEHAQKLAELFNKKASVDDISAALEGMKDLDAKMANEIDSRANDIMGEFNQTRHVAARRHPHSFTAIPSQARSEPTCPPPRRHDWTQNLSTLGSAINTKADEVWLKSLEDQIRQEMERLRKNQGGKGITRKELEAKLAELREKLKQARRAVSLYLSPTSTYTARLAGRGAARGGFRGVPLHRVQPPGLELERVDGAGQRPERGQRAAARKHRARARGHEGAEAQGSGPPGAVTRPSRFPQ
jgi:hypothetical protein